ncbi:MAG: co-chaperone GroES family protein [Candidatus Marinimicrobia bacterium]|nr:co-chaperone GroES family protein [Candidatus Neomarinimicrobiota bacterium]MCF7829939.1 co-chaperone GroES family protein [Candidatus Neomarinimicrobiota bacterium]MCF7881907.1 co-chaperone GroES family protein [Candidatus Neomarinimicrobiota bacterium]
MKTDSNRSVLVVGDKVLIKPEAESNKTESGLFLPEGVKQKEQVQGGYVAKVGPGYPLPDIANEDEPWAQSGDTDLRYIPLQANEGDYAVFLRKHAIEVEIDEQEYLIVSHSSIVLLLRDEDIVG